MSNAKVSWPVRPSTPSATLLSRQSAQGNRAADREIGFQFSVARRSGSPACSPPPHDEVSRPPHDQPQPGTAGITFVRHLASVTRRLPNRSKDAGPSLSVRVFFCASVAPLPMAVRGAATKGHASEALTPTANRANAIAVRPPQTRGLGRRTCLLHARRHEPAKHGGSVASRQQRRPSLLHAPHPLAFKSPNATSSPSCSAACDFAPYVTHHLGWWVDEMP